MGKDLAVAIIHGMGSQDPDFARPLIRELTERLEGEGQRVAWQWIYWQDLVQDRELKYLDRAVRKPNDLDYLRLRRFVLTALGDAVAYQKVESPSSTTYEDVHGRIRQKLEDLRTVELEGDVPLVILAHSLGGHIVSNYVYDMQKAGTAGAPNAFERMETLAGLITFGCNIPLFTFAYKKVVPIRFPGKKLSPRLKARARWLNFYDPDDVLGYPLKPINEAYRKVVSRDVAINVGGIGSAWNPMSHSGYWTDDDFTKPVARFLRTLL